MTKRILRTAAAAGLACCALIGSAAADCIGAASTTAEVNLRSAAGTANAVLATSGKGDAVIVESGPENGWYRVWLDGQWGYMSAGLPQL